MTANTENEAAKQKAERIARIILVTFEELGRHYPRAELVYALIRHTADLRREGQKESPPLPDIPEELKSLVRPGVLNLNSADSLTRLYVLMYLIDAASRDSADNFWLNEDAADQILGFVGDAKRAIFAFPLSLRPWLEFLSRNRARLASSEGCNVRLHVEGPLVSVAKDLLWIIGLAGKDIAQVSDKPYVRHERLRFDIEVICPPQKISVIDPMRISSKGKTGRRRGRVELTVDGKLVSESIKPHHQQIEALADTVRNADGQALLLVNAPILTNRVGMEASVARELLNSWRLRSVVAVPKGMLGDHFSGEAHFIFVGPRDWGRSEACLVNAGHEALALSVGRGGKRIARGVSWAEVIKDSAELPTTNDGPWAIVQTSDLLQRSLPVRPSRYTTVSAYDKLTKFNKQHACSSLRSLVSFIRPRSLTASAAGDVEVFEAGIADIQASGMIGVPTKTITILPEEHHIATKQTLQREDLVFSIKGRVGAVGIYMRDRDDLGSIVTAGQSLMILRPDPSIPGLPAVLYSYLTHPDVQDYIKTLVIGTTAATIRQRDLDDLQIPMPLIEERRALLERLQARLQKHVELDRTRRALEEEKLDDWPYIGKPLPEKDIDPEDEMFML